MFTSEIKLRVRYAETDRMGFVYYGNYAVYFEVARVEALRTLGISYRNIEDSGILLPVVNYTVKFLKPVHYDEELRIVTVIQKLPQVRINFEYECYNEKGEVVTTAYTTLAFIRKSSNKPCGAPSDVLEKMGKYFINR